MENIIVAVVLLSVVIAASAYIFKAKKSGKKCIGCPDGDCSSCNCCCDKSK